MTPFNFLFQTIQIQAQHIWNHFYGPDGFMDQIFLLSIPAWRRRGHSLTACNATPPAKSKMATRVPQNGRRDLERCLLLVLGHFTQLSLNKVFDPSTPSMRKDCDGEVEKRKIIKMTCSNLICPYLTSPY